MRPGRLYYALTWGAAAAVAAALVASWIALYARHVDLIGPGLVEQIDRKTIVPKLWVEVLGFSAVGIALLGVAYRAWRRTSPILVPETMDALKRRLDAAREAGEQASRSLLPRVVLALKEVAGGGMRDCEDFQQWFGHLLTMWGFVGLFVTTSLDAVVNRAADPLPLLHPVRLLGNVTGIMFVTGLTLALARRALLARARASTQFGDWTFLLALWGTGVTGFAVQWYADLANQGATAWWYIIHLVFVALILATAPWTKFVHAVWRPTWVLYRLLVVDRKP